MCYERFFRCEVGYPRLGAASELTGIESQIVNPIDTSPEEFRHLCEQIADIAAEYLSGIDSRKILPNEGGLELDSVYRTALPETGIGAEAIQSLVDVARQSRAQNGRFFGYVLGSGEPVAAATDLLCSVLNQNVTAWRSAPAAMTIERTVVDWLAEAIGCESFRGILTGGGSSANLMALTMAREAKAPANERGVRAGAAAAFYASSEVHMSIPKAIALLGIGRENLRRIPVDEAFRIIPEQLEQAMRKDKRNGVTPIAVIATAGTVNTGRD